MLKFQAKLIRLVNDRVITQKDALLVILAKDGLKPLSSVGFFASMELIDVLEEYRIPFLIRDGRIHIGNHLHADNLDGQAFGFPPCCSAVHGDIIMSRR